MIEWDDSHQPVEREVITAVESFLRIKFPEDYIECAMLHHGGQPAPYCLPDDITGTCVQSLLHYTEPPSWKYRDTGHILEIYKIFYMEYGFLPIQVFPFADDPGGSLFAFDYRKSEDSPTIIFLDHEATDDEGHFLETFVANSFTEFLSLLHDPDNDFQMETAETVMREDQTALRKLAE